MLITCYIITPFLLWLIYYDYYMRCRHDAAPLISRCHAATPMSLRTEHIIAITPTTTCHDAAIEIITR